METITVDCYCGRTHVMTQQFVMTVYYMADNSKLSTQALIEKAIEHWHNKEMN
jgi:hypothetical protein